MKTVICGALRLVYLCQCQYPWICHKTCQNKIFWQYARHLLIILYSYKFGSELSNSFWSSRGQQSSCSLAHSHCLRKKFLKNSTFPYGDPRQHKIQRVIQKIWVCNLRRTDKQTLTYIQAFLIWRCYFIST